MNPRNQTVLCLSLFVLSMVLVAPASADDGGGGALVGSWESVAVLDGTTDEVPSLFTFNRGGTFTATGSTVANSGGHGAWKKIGPRTFKATNVSFIYGPTGEIIATLNANTTIVVASGGQDYDAEFEGEIRFTNGAVQPFSGTAVASRINVAGCDDDDDSDSDSD